MSASSGKKWGKGRLWTDQETDQLKSLYPHTNVKELARGLQRSESSIRGQAIRLGFVRRPWVRRPPQHTGNPYDYLSPQERGYIAGLLDGEGTIALMNIEQNMYPRVSIVNTDGRMIKWLQEKLGGRVRIRPPKPSKRGTTKPLYMWDLSGTVRCQCLLEVVMPYLITKRAKAVEALSLSPPRLRD